MAASWTQPIIRHMELRNNKIINTFFIFSKKQVNSEKPQIDTAPILLSTSSFDLASEQSEQYRDPRIVESSHDADESWSGKKLVFSIHRKVLA